MLRKFVFVDKLVSYEYFMDELKDYELQLLIDGSEVTNMVSWNQTRMMMYSFLSPYQKKGSHLKPVDIMKFPWDEGFAVTEKIDTNITNQQVDVMRHRAEQMREILNKKEMKTHAE